jgi:lipopolysaccharide transport system permease protein
MNVAVGRADARRAYFEILSELTRKDLRVRYRNSLLGYVWSVLNPLLLAGVFYLAFGLILKAAIEHYVLFLVVGLFPWQWLTNSVGTSANAYIGNASLVKKINFPRSLLPLSTQLHDLVHFIVALPVTFAFALWEGVPLHASLLWGVPVLVISQFGINYGLSLVVAAANPFFRDVERLVGIVLMLLFYCTPIVYPAERIPPHLLPWFRLNPMEPVISAWHGLVLEGVVLWTDVGRALAASAVMLAIGTWVHVRLRWRLAEVV